MSEIWCSAPDETDFHHPTATVCAASSSLDEAAAQLDQAIERATTGHAPPASSGVVRKKPDPAAQTPAAGYSDSEFHFSFETCDVHSLRICFSSAGFVFFNCPFMKFEIVVSKYLLLFILCVFVGQQVQRKAEKRGRTETQVVLGVDHDEDKYRRRGPLDFLGRWTGYGHVLLAALFLLILLGGYFVRIDSTQSWLGIYRCNSGVLLALYYGSVTL